MSAACFTVDSSFPSLELPVEGDICDLLVVISRYLYYDQCC